MSPPVARFADLVEMIDQLSLEERESLVDVVRKRIADDRRRRLTASIRSAKREHQRGRTKPVTPDELMREIMA
jgi:tetrahydromethanopterin S-methyltransferase subunit A